YFISGEINSEVADQDAKMASIAETYSDARQATLDGISIDYPDWHFNVRPSNTEPLLRLNLESLVSVEDMERRRDEVLELIRSGAEVAGLDRMAPILRDYSHAMEREDEFAGALMRRHGIPDDVLVALQSVSRSFRAWGASAEITRPLADGSTLELAGRRLRVL